MSTSVEKQARIADGRSHRCKECPLRPCSETQFKVCGDSFVEGFVKGAIYANKQLLKINAK